MNLRRATLSDLELLRNWDQQPRLIESDPNDDWNWELELARTPLWREQLVAEVDGRPIGFIQIIDPALEESKYWGACENVIDPLFSNTRAHQFYERLGFIFVERRSFGIDDCAVYCLDRTKWELHQKNLGVPLA